MTSVGRSPWPGGESDLRFELSSAARAPAGESNRRSAVSSAAQPIARNQAEVDTANRLWAALREVEDPEIPVSLVDMGLIVSIDYNVSTRAAQLKITYTAMGCPAMDMIQDDIRARLLREPDVDHVEIEVVWDPVWSHGRLSRSARGRMRELGLVV